MLKFVTLYVYSLCNSSKNSFKYSANWRVFSNLTILHTIVKCITTIYLYHNLIDMFNHPYHKPNPVYQFHS